MVARYVSVVLVFLSVFLCTACRMEGASFPRSDAMMSPSAPESHAIRAHPPGTLLHDARGRLWMVETWPERTFMSPQALQSAHRERREAIAMAFNEELCIVNRGRVWHGLEGWTLYRLPDEAYWYIDELRHERRAASREVIRAYRHDPAQAYVWPMSTEAFLGQFHDVGLMLPPDGTLARTDQGLFYYYDGVWHPFASEDLARQAGYGSLTPVSLAQDVLLRFGAVGEPLDASVFQTCPASLPDARRAEDADADGALRANDCDDHDANRGNGFTEICDGIDNDCDGDVDEGFGIGVACVLDDGCQSPGLMECNFDGYSVSCQNQEAQCDR